MLQLHIQSPLLIILHDQLLIVVGEINLLQAWISTNLTTSLTNSNTFSLFEPFDDCSEYPWKAVIGLLMDEPLLVKIGRVLWPSPLWCIPKTRTDLLWWCTSENFRFYTSSYSFPGVGEVNSLFFYCNLPC